MGFYWDSTLDETPPNVVNVTGGCVITPSNTGVTVSNSNADYGFAYIEPLNAIGDINDVTIEFEFVSDYVNRKHIGILLMRNDVTSASGIRIAALDSSTQATDFTNNVNYDGSRFLTYGAVVGSTHKYRVVNNTFTSELYIDDVSVSEKYKTFLDGHPIDWTGIGVFVYGAAVKITKIESLDVEEQTVYPFDSKPLPAMNPIFANKETIEQANPQPKKTQYLTYDNLAKVVSKVGNYKSILNRLGEMREVGFYQSTVTVSDIPKPNTRVLCFTNNGQLLDETYSNESGVYRFDHLLMENKYLFVAQYNNGNPQVAPDYLAAASDWQTPTAYGSD